MQDFKSSSITHKPWSREAYLAQAQELLRVELGHLVGVGFHRTAHVENRRPSGDWGGGGLKKTETQIFRSVFVGVSAIHNYSAPV